MARRAAQDAQKPLWAEWHWVQPSELPQRCRDVRPFRPRHSVYFEQHSTAPSYEQTDHWFRLDHRMQQGLHILQQAMLLQVILCRVCHSFRVGCRGCGAWCHLHPQQHSTLLEGNAIEILIGMKHQTCRC